MVSVFGSVWHQPTYAMCLTTNGFFFCPAILDGRMRAECEPGADCPSLARLVGPKVCGSKYYWIIDLVVDTEHIYPPPPLLPSSAYRCRLDSAYVLTI